MSSGSLRKPFALAAALALAGASLQGCNLFSSMDEPQDEPEIVEQALVDMDNGKCSDAIKRFQGRTSLSDDALHTLGWAQLCAGGASLTNVAKNLFSYSTSSSNTAIVGTLANALIPQDATRVQSFDDAISTFGQMQNENVRSVNVVMARLIKVAGVLAKSAANDGDGSKVKRADIGPCTAGCTTCGTGAAGQMSDSDANSVGSAVIGAVNSQIPGLGSVGDLTSRLGQSFTLGQTAATYRCAVYLQLLSE